MEFLGISFLTELVYTMRGVWMFYVIAVRWLKNIHLLVDLSDRFSV